jgi:NADH-quinone oxidoreductase subunit J
MFLYTDFFIVFQISGFLLLVAMIGAIVLAKNENLNIKSQKIIYQKSLDKKKVIKLK